MVRFIRNLIMIASSLFSSFIFTQVTLGNDQSSLPGAILQLKNKNENSDGSNSDKGLMLPRVDLVNASSLEPCLNSIQNADPDERLRHAGLVVFNTKLDSDENLCPGIYVWDSERWNPLLGECFALRLDKESQNILTGNQAVVNATVVPASALSNLTWVSADPSIATVDNNGKITAVAPGSTTITATVTHDGKTEQKSVVVNVANLSVVISIDKNKLVIGETAQFTATINPDWADVNLIWGSYHNGTLLNISQDGLVEALDTQWGNESGVQVYATTDKNIGGAPLMYYQNIIIGKPTLVIASNNHIDVMLDNIGNDFSKYDLNKISEVKPSWVDMSKVEVELSLEDPYGYVTFDPDTWELQGINGLEDPVIYPNSLRPMINIKTTYNHDTGVPLVTNTTATVSVYDLNPYQITDSRDGEKYWIGFVGRYNKWLHAKGGEYAYPTGNWWMLENLRTKVGLDGNPKPMGLDTWIYPADHQVLGNISYVDDNTYYDTNKRVGLLYNVKFVYGNTFPLNPDLVNKRFEMGLPPMGNKYVYTGWYNSVCPSGFYLPNQTNSIRITIDEKTKDNTFQNGTVGNSRKAENGGLDIYPTGKDIRAQMDGTRFTLGTSTDGQGNYTTFHISRSEWMQDEWGWGTYNDSRNPQIFTYDIAGKTLNWFNEASLYNAFSPVRCVRHLGGNDIKPYTP